MSASATFRCGVMVALAMLTLGAWAQTRDGETVYQAECAQCHSQSSPRMPSREQLGERSASAIVQALTRGTMRVVGTFNLNGPERVAVAEFLSGETYDPNWAASSEQWCSDSPWQSTAAFSQAHWNGWGNGPENTRFQDAPAAGMDVNSVPGLKLKWAFAFPGETIAESQPTVVGGRIFVGSRSGAVYALNAENGCVHWRFQADGPVKASPLLAPVHTTPDAELGVYFGDLIGNAYGLDAATGKLLWRVRPEAHPTARIMGSMQFAKGQLLLPMTSVESYLAGDVDQACCKFRGSLIALDPATGAQRWQYFTVEQPQQTGVNSKGVATFGPSGATIWSAPSFDRVSGNAYIGTGENYSHPATQTSDAIIAVDVNKGFYQWAYQGLAGDAWNMSCGTDDPFNCPQDNGPDFDFGSSPIITTLADGRRLIIAAQKSGVVHAIDAGKQGAVVWQRQIAKGGVLGGIEWGPATDGERVYVSIADIGWNSADLLKPDLSLDSQAGGGLVALELTTGKVLWEAPGIKCEGRKNCSPAQTAAVTAIPGVVFAGSVSGELRAFDSADGSVIWHYDTAREFETVNGATGRGGALDATGPVVVDGWLYLVSGYNKWGGLPGNVLLAFTTEPAE